MATSQPRIIPLVSSLAQTVIDSSVPAPEDSVLEAILKSECFEKSPKLGTLLQYLWEHRHKEVSEYAIAVDALERRPDFNSKIDANVRVQIARLRKLLAKYYEGEGANSEIRLVIPLGTHRIDWKKVPSAEDKAKPGAGVVAAPAEPLLPSGSIRSPASGVDVESRWKSHKAFVALTFVAVLVLATSIGWLFTVLGRRKEVTRANGTPQLSLFWKDILENGRTTRIILPTPVFFTWVKHGEGSGLMARDVSVNDSDKLTKSASLAQIEKQFGKPKAWQNYTVASDAVAALQLVDYLNRYGIQQRVSTSAESPQQITNYENIIAFGSPTLISAYKPDWDRLSYRLGSNGEYVIDTLEQGTSHHLFEEISEPGSRVVIPGLIALIPQGDAGSWILLIQGVQNAALISYLTSEGGIQEIEQARARYGHTTFFEAVFLSEINGGNPIQSRLVAFRPFVERPR